MLENGFRMFLFHSFKTLLWIRGNKSLPLFFVQFDIFLIPYVRKNKNGAFFASHVTVYAASNLLIRKNKKI